MLSGSSGQNPTAVEHCVSAPKTLGDLLTALEGEKEYAMLRTAAQHVTDFLKVTPEQLAIDALLNVSPPVFRYYLVKRHYKDTSARAYAGYLRRLGVHAKRLGCVPAQPKVAQSWTEIFAAMPKNGCRGIVRHAIRIGRLPCEFSDSDLNTYGQEMLDCGRSYGTVANLTRVFRHVLFKSGLAPKLPRIACSAQKNHPYGTTLHFFPPKLKTEVETLVEWKQAAYARAESEGIAQLLRETLKPASPGFTDLSQTLKSVKTLAA
jgi:hypothetical protein